MQSTARDRRTGQFKKKKALGELDAASRERAEA